MSVAVAYEPESIVQQQLPIGEPARQKRKSPAGVATTSLAFSAYVGSNADVFPHILSLHVPDGSVIADVTYGVGAFWRQAPRDRYHLLATDIKMGVDCRHLPYDDASIDCVVLDPPYMEGLYRTSADHLAGAGSHITFRNTYSNGQATPHEEGRPRWHDAVVHFYLEAAYEALRVLKPYGTLIVKCQDEVSANRQRLTHVELINALEKQGLYTKDLFIVVRPNKPGVSRIKQQEHARKNHSYFLVFVKTNGGSPRKKAARKSATKPTTR